MAATKHILIVEDEGLIALDMETTLTDAGYRVSIAASNHQAEEILSASSVDLAIIDFHLQDVTSVGLAKRLDALRVPFIVCSGTAGLAELGEAFGNAHFLPKPFTTDALLSSIQVRSN